MSITLNEKSKASIERNTGIKFSDISTMDLEDITKLIEKKIKKKLKRDFIVDFRLPNRGSVYLYLNRFFSFNIKDLDNRIDSLK